ncbi:hypothetical protein BH09ACT1_BH09ACT1_10940 [soil metagenome]
MRRSLGLTTVAVAIAALTLASATSASAADPQTVFVNEGFTGSSVSGYIKPTASAGNVACLTASSNTTTTTSLPGCTTPTGDDDAVGSGALRLTDNVGSQEGGIGATQSIPISKGLDATFDSYQYSPSNTGADGIVFYLAATDPYNPQVPTAIGQSGGSLGYSATGSSPGLANAYLGLGLDVWGNYLSSGFDGTGCTTAPGSTTQATNVTVRGPGNGTTGYCVIPGYNQSLGGKPALRGSTRADSDVPVEVVVNPTATAMLSAGSTNLTATSVAARSYAIIVKTIGSSTKTVVTGTLPDLRTSAYAGLVAPSWYDPATGLPYKLTYGWVASTGGTTDVHEVNHLVAQTLTGPVPVLTATSSVSSASVAHAATATYTVNPAVSTTGGSEDENVQVTTTFPAGLTPTAYAGTNYLCTISGQTETCTFVGTTAAGTALPALTLPFTASGNASTTAKTISSVVASTDASAVTTTASVTVTKIATTTALAIAPSPPVYASSQTLTATVAPAAATGTVRFTDTTTGAVLCAAAPITSGVATCTTTTGGPSGSHTLTALYSGDANYLTSTGTAAFITQGATSAMTVTASPADIQYGETSTFTTIGIASAATGTVTYTDASGTVLCAATLPTTSCTTSDTLAAGSYDVTANYSGDANYAPAYSAVAARLTVAKNPIAGIATSASGTSAASTLNGRFARLTTLSVAGFPADATGTVTFTNNGTVLCTATLPDTSCTTTALDGGDYTILASYSGDAIYAAGSSTFALTVPAAVVAALAYTGSQIVVPIAILTALLLLASGLVLLIAARRRRLL